MREFDDEQRERIRSLKERYEERIEKREGRLQRGEVIDEKLPFVHSGFASHNHKIGISSVGLGDIETAREHFSLASREYRTSVREARKREGDLHTFRNIPMTLVNGVYSAALAGNGELARTLSGEILELPPEMRPPHEFVDESVTFHPDKYYLARCLAGAVLDRVDQADLEELEAINEDKPPVDALYGQAILDFARGLDEDEPALVERGVESMLEHHDRELDEENVVDVLMCPQATALLVLARQRGYDVEIDSEFVPEDLVEASA